MDATTRTLKDVAVQRDCRPTAPSNRHQRAEWTP